MMSKDNDFPSFVGQSGHFYVRVRSSTGGYTSRVAVYPSTDAYDKRSCLPLFIDFQQAIQDYAEEQRIYTASLTTTPPPAEPWMREAAEDQYRNAFWSRVNAMEAQRYAA